VKAEMTIKPEWDVAVAVDAGDWLVRPELLLIAEHVAGAVRVAVSDSPSRAEISIMFTNDQRMAALNNRWRAKPQPTNVLSFPAPRSVARADGAVQLGDIVLGFETVTLEAAQMGLTLPNHITHLLVHGLLHLLGYDHEDNSAAEVMETLETHILAKLGIANPYSSPEVELISAGGINRQ